MAYIYADNAATTRLSDAAFEAMKPYMLNEYGNASTLYKLGRSAHKAVGKRARRFRKGHKCISCGDIFHLRRYRKR